MVSPPIYLACLTPAGTAAIATLGLYGPDAWRLVEPVFQPHHPASDPRLPCLGRIGEQLSDQVVVTVDRSGAQERVEIHCHGGPAVIDMLLRLFRDRGAKQIGWEEWQRLTTASRLRAETAIALAHAPTLRTANILLDQYAGAFERALREAIAALGDGDPAPLHAMIERIPLGRHLIHAWRVVLAGAPNTGKSSLLNAILGFARSIISPIPGTTRDVVTARTAIHGWPMEFADTAGADDAAVDLEREGIRRGRQAWAEADLCLWIVDPTQDQMALPPPLTVRHFLVVNKIDLPAKHAPPRSPTGTIYRVSALTGEGVPALMEAMADWFVPVAPEAGAAVPFSSEVCDILLAADQAWKRGEPTKAVEMLTSLL